MIYIQKKHEPLIFKQYKKDCEASFDKTASYKNLSEKEANKEVFKQLRLSLLEEQKYVCCYCLQRIPEQPPKSKNKNKQEVIKEMLNLQKMKTEHFHPKRGKDGSEALELDYSNLLAACKGNEHGEGKKHCDVTKGSTLLKHILNPALGKAKDFKTTIKYKVKVKSKEVIILSQNEDINTELNKVLNLNEQSLRSKRFSVWNAVWRKIGQKDINVNRIENLLAEYEPNSDKVELRPFCDFITEWLKNHLRKYKK